MRSYTISSKNELTRASFIPDKGGLCTSIVMPGKQGPKELLFYNPDLFSGSPFCFPICGRLERQGNLGQYYYQGHLYELPIHGFAKDKPWLVKDTGQDYILLVLRDDEQTRLCYPFHFTVELLYEISDHHLFCRQTYTNHGDQPMPYYAGFHPYFLTPLANQGKQNVILNFSPSKRFRYNQRLTDIVGEQPLFILPTAANNSEINEQLLLMGEDKQVHLSYPHEGIVYMSAEGVEDRNLFSYLQIYSPTEQPFICLEPWMSHPNALNSVSGVRWLAPGQSEHGLLRLWLE